MKQLISILILPIKVLNLLNVRLYGNTVVQPAPDQANGILKNAIIAVPLKYLNSFWRSREMPLINCKAELSLKLTKDYASFRYRLMGI